jgi:hypothetical protein
MSGVTLHFRSLEKEMVLTVSTDRDVPRWQRPDDRHSQHRFERHNDIQGCWRPHHRHSHST